MILSRVTPLRAELAHLQGAETRLQAIRAEVSEFESTRRALEQYKDAAARAAADIQRLHAEQVEPSRPVIDTRETAILQAVGIYEYRHPLDDAPA